MGYAGREFDFTYSAAIARELVRRLIAEPLAPSTLINVNCPAGEPAGIEITRLGKRLYDDELKLVEEGDAGRQALQDLRLRALVRGRGRAPTSPRSRAAGSRSPRSTSTSPTTASWSGSPAGTSTSSAAETGLAARG